MTERHRETAAQVLTVAELIVRVEDQLPVALSLGLDEYGRPQVQRLVVPPTRGVGNGDSDSSQGELVPIPGSLGQLAGTLEGGQALGVRVASGAGQGSAEEQLELELARAPLLLFDASDQLDRALEVPNGLFVRRALLRLAACLLVVTDRQVGQPCRLCVSGDQLRTRSLGRTFEQCVHDPA